MPAVEVVMTILHAGGKFGKGGYKVSGGLHGVGISVVNALSERMITRVKRDGKIYEIRFERGITVQKLKVIGKTEGTAPTSGSCRTRRCSRRPTFIGTSCRSACANSPFSTAVCRSRCATSAPEEVKERTFVYDGGIVSFVEHLNDKKDPLHPIISTNGERDGIASSARCSGPTRTARRSSRSRTTSTRPKAACICSGFRTAVGNAINTYAKKRGMLKESDGTSRPTTAWRG